MVRYVTVAAVLIVLAFSPAFAEEAIVVAPVRIPPVEQLRPPPLDWNNQNKMEADVTGNVCCFKAVRSHWNDQIRIEAQIIAGPRDVDIAKIDFSEIKVGIINPPSIEREPIEIEFKYTPINPQYLTPVPEPGSFVVLGAGAIGVILQWRRRRAINLQ